MALAPPLACLRAPSLEPSTFSSIVHLTSLSPLGNRVAFWSAGWVNSLSERNNGSVFSHLALFIPVTFTCHMPSLRQLRPTKNELLRDGDGGQKYANRTPLDIVVGFVVKAGKIDESVSMSVTWLTQMGPVGAKRSGNPFFLSRSVHESRP